MSSDEGLSPTTVITCPVRLSYAHVFNTKLNTLKNPPAEEYSCVLWIPKKPNEFCKDPVTTLKAIKAAIDAAKAAKIPKVAKWSNPLRDGDVETNDAGEPRAPGYWYLNSSAKKEYPPVLIDGSKAPVSGGWESGDWARAKITFFGFDQAVNKGVGCGLRALQFVYKDEPLGQSTDPAAVAEEFGVVEGAHTGVGEPVSSVEESEYNPFDDK